MTDLWKKLKIQDILALLLSAVVCVGSAQAGAQPVASSVNLATATSSAVLLSDLHFDPLHDPAKVPLLAKAPIEQWSAILGQPDSPDRASAFAAIQKACKAKVAMDSPYALLSSALKAAKAQTPNAKFVMVSGDLLVHELDCRFRFAMKLPKAEENQTGEFVSAQFAEKTANFVMKQVESSFAGMPVYLALGNNDSECDHQRMGLHDPFFKATGMSVMDGLLGVSAVERKQALTDFETGGYYAVTMSAPMEKTRLVVVNDVFMMTKYATCKGDTKDRSGATEEMAWLTKELDGARERHERVWLMAHLPPTINPKSTLEKEGEFCAGGKPEPYMYSDDFVSLLASYGDVVKLGLFGHTHLDEIHLIGAKGSQIPVKEIPSVSPVDGNTPSFTVAQVSPALAQLMDYTAYKASNITGIGTVWNREYSFREAYREPNFSVASMSDLISTLRADKEGTGPVSQAYQAHYFKAQPTWDVGAHWPGYVCSIDHPDVAGFRACACGK
jgi:sphingomyelin phosphodiesterase acid-like 3